MRRTLTGLALALSSVLVSGCAPLLLGAGAGTGYLLSQEVLPNDVHVAQFSLDVDKVWPSVKETMTIFQDPGSELTVQEFPRTINAKVDGAKVLVEVEAHDLDQTTVRVQAEKYLSQANTISEEVMEKIKDQIGKL